MFRRVASQAVTATLRPLGLKLVRDRRSTSEEPKNPGPTRASTPVAEAYRGLQGVA
jgi:hypothetical protein